MVFIMRYIEIPSNMLEKKSTLVEMISRKRKAANGDICLKPTFLSESEKKDEFYERIRFEEAFCNIYENIDHPEEVFLEVRQDDLTTMSTSTYESKRISSSEFEWNYEAVPLARVKEVHDKIKLFTADIKNSSLSPFEKTMALYMIATHFIDSYKGDRKDSKIIDSSVMHILSDDEDGYKIQCAGYTDLFCRMAYECGIHTKEMQMDWDDSTAGHSVAIVDLDDEKYGIHGSFICDVRTESDFREEYRQQDYNGFNYFCLPFEDFNAMSIFNPNRSNMSRECWYAINNFAAFGGEGISNERIKIDDIFVALNHLYKFIFENDGKSSILKEHDFDGIRDLNTIRDRIDEINEALYFQSFENTADELSQMMVSEEVNKARVSDNSRGK